MFVVTSNLYDHIRRFGSEKEAIEYITKLNNKIFEECVVKPLEVCAFDFVTDTAIELIKQFQREKYFIIEEKK